MIGILQVGGVEEYTLTQAMTEGRVTKPIVAWCIGTCAKMFTSEVRTIYMITLVAAIVSLIYANLFQFDCETSTFGFCKSSWNPFL